MHTVTLCSFLLLFFFLSESEARYTTDKPTSIHKPTHGCDSTVFHTTTSFTKCAPIITVTVVKPVTSTKIATVQESITSTISTETTTIITTTIPTTTTTTTTFTLSYEVTLKTNTETTTTVTSVATETSTTTTTAVTPAAATIASIHPRAIYDPLASPNITKFCYSTSSKRDLISLKKRKCKLIHCQTIVHICDTVSTSTIHVFTTTTDIIPTTKTNVQSFTDIVDNTITETSTATSFITSTSISKTTKTDIETDIIETITSTAVISMATTTTTTTTLVQIASSSCVPLGDRCHLG